MDMKFSGKLQTALRLLGLEKGSDFAPPKSQDPADKLLHEFFVASLMKKIGEDRKKIAQEMIEDMHPDDVSRIMADAIKFDAMQTEALVQTEHYNGVLKVNKPVQSIDKTVFCNELIKLGVDEVTVNKALAAAGKTNAPAKTLTVMPTVEKK